MISEVKIYNTLKRKKETFIPCEEDKVKFYSCGPTTYDFLHVGNARAAIVADIIYRIFYEIGYKITYVRNFTDVDDKIIKSAKKLGRDPIEHSQIMLQECVKDFKALNIKKPTYTPKVTDSINDIVKMVKELVDCGAAYVHNGEVLFHVPSFDEYGKLSNMDIESLKHGKRVELESHKKHPCDFVLWKPAKKGEPSWDSPWGKGRPGWHIECSAMAKKYLGDTIDIHHGGVDLIFPHHENEIAQSRKANGQEFCKYWCHNEHLNFGKEKMSKSLGNVITIRNFVDNFGGAVLRQIFISSHYRARLEWSKKVICQAITEVERIHQFVIEFQDAKQFVDNSIDQESEQIDINKFQTLLENIKKDLCDDFNTPNALSSFFILIRSFRRDYLTSNKKITRELYDIVNLIISTIKNATGAIRENPKQVLEELNIARKNVGDVCFDIDDVDIEELIKERLQAKKDKNWKRADEIRKELLEKNIILQDHPDGTTTWKYK